MFDHRHYVPVLRWKRGEQVALRHLSLTTRTGLTPLIELPPTRFSVDDPESSGALDDDLADVAAQVDKNWRTRPIFFDLGLLPQALRSRNGRHHVDALWAAAARRQLSLVPVTALSRDHEYQAAVRRAVGTQGYGLCVRLVREDADSPSLRHRLEILLAQLGVAPSRVHLIVDYRDAVCSDLASLCARLPYLAEWRSFTVIAGTFPADLTGFKLGENWLPRSEWLSWQANVVGSGRLQRIPTFGDYSTQHAVYREPPSGANFSASIRYTTADAWLIMRGQGVFTPGSPGWNQWPANALLLREHAAFCGPEFSAGDAYIWSMGGQTKRTGNPESWLRAGINHHVTFVVDQIRRLFPG